MSALHAIVEDGQWTHECHVTSESRGRARVISVTGILNWATVGTFRETVSDGTGESVVVDLSAVTRMDAAGTGGVLLAVSRLQTPRCRVAVVVGNPVVSHVAASVGLASVVPVASSLSEALILVGEPRSVGVPA